MTLPSLPSPPELIPDAPNGRKKPSVEHIVLGAVLIAVILGAASWLMFKPASTPSAAKPRPGTILPIPARVRPLVTKPVLAADVKQAAFLKAANVICTKLNVQTTKLGAFPKDLPGQAAFMRKGLLYQAQTLKRLKALHAPAADAAALKKVYADEAAMDAIGVKLTKALASGNRPVAKGLLTKINSTSNRLSTEYGTAGLTACAS